MIWRFKSRVPMRHSLRLTALGALLALVPAVPCFSASVPFLHGGRLHTVRDGKINPGFWEVGFESALGEDGTVVYLEQPAKNTPYFDEKPHAMAIVVRRYDARSDTLGPARSIVPPGGRQFQQLALRGNILYLAGIKESDHFLGWIDISRADPVFKELDSLSLLKRKPLDDLVIDGEHLYGIDDIVEPKWMVVYDLSSPPSPSLKGLIELRAGVNQQIVKAVAGPEHLALLCHSVHMGGASLSVELYDKRSYAFSGGLAIESTKPAGSDWSWGEIAGTYATRDRELIFADGNLYVSGFGGGVGAARIPAGWNLQAARENAPIMTEVKGQAGEVIPVFALPGDNSRSHLDTLSLQPVFVKESGGATPLYDMTYLPSLGKYVVWTRRGAPPFLADLAQLSLGGSDATSRAESKTGMPTSEELPVLLTPETGAVVTAPETTFSWKSAPGAQGYDLTIAGQRGAPFREKLSTTTSTVPLGFGSYDNVGERLLWSVRARFEDDRVGDWQNPREVMFQFEEVGLRSQHPRLEPRVPFDQVKMTMTLDPETPVADGRTLVRVRASVMDLANRPVSDAIVGFRLQGYHSRAGKIVGPHEPTEVGDRLADSGSFVIGKAPVSSRQISENLFSDYVTLVTDAKGEALALFRVPAWGDHMAEKPILLQMAYFGSISRAERSLYFRKP